MGDVAMDVMAEAVRAEFGGRIEGGGAFVTHVRETEYGDFKVELDASVLRDHRYREHLRRLGIELDEKDRESLDRWLADAAARLVPYEIVAPPVPMSVLPRLDRVRAALQRQGAQGTQASLLYAFGLQLNIEAHSLNADWLTPLLQAFVLLYEALVKAGNIDLARRLTPFIKPFPGSYVRHLLHPAYRPGIGELIDDYLEYNPTRNRPLDMLPLFAVVDEQRIGSAPVEHELIKPRPALHYRLPNCEIDDPDWTLARPFNAWAEVEHLAADTDRLEEAREEYLRRPAQALGQFADEWARRIRDWF